MAAPAAVLQILVTANTAQAVTGLRAVDAQGKKTAASSAAATSRMSSGFSRMASVAKTALVGGVAYGLYSGVKAGIEFEKQMDAVGAVADANRKEMRKLEDQALKLGAATTFSATEAAQAQEELAKGGLKTSDILGGALKASLNLAAAGQMELADASETTVNAMKLFNLEGKEAGRVADVMATAANTTTADVADFAMALRQGGSAAQAAGYDLNQTMVVLEALAEAGIKNSDAGTSMKTAFLQLLAPTETQAALAEKLNIEWVNQAGNLKNAVGLSKELQGALGDQTNAQQAANLKVLAGTDGFRTLNSLLDAGPAKLRELSAANLEQGTAQEIAKKKLDNTAGSIEQLQGAWETLSIELFKKAQSPFRGIIDSMTGAVEDFTDVITDKKLTTDEKISKVINMITKAIGDAIPKIVAAGAKIGFALVRGIARAFIEGSLLTKLFIGAAIFKVFGGMAAIKASSTRLGTVMGKFAGKGWIIGLLIALPALGIEIGKWIRKRREWFVNAGSDIGEFIVNGMLAAINFGIRQINEAMDAANIFAVAGVDAPNIPEIGDVDFGHVRAEVKKTEVPFQNLIDTLDKTGKKFRGTRDSGVSSLDDLGEKTNRTGSIWDHYGDIVDKSGDRADRASNKHRANVRDDLGDVGKNLDRGGKDVDRYSDDTHKGFMAIIKDSSRMARGVTGNNANMVNTVGEGQETLRENTNKALKGFNVKETIKWAIKKAKKATQTVEGMQTGGVIVPGQGSGDKVEALLEPGEVVLNREAVKAMGGARRADRINKVIPRFAAGGIVPIEGMPGEFIHQSIAADVQGLIQKYKLLITDGYAPTGHAASGEHPLGLAIDAVPGAGGSWDLIDQLAHWAEPAQNQPIDPFRWVGYDGDSGHGRGDHIHLSWNAGQNISGMGAALVDGIARLILKGPKGPLKEMGQASLDKVHGAANKYLAAHSGSGIEMGGTAGSPIASLPDALQKYNKTYPEAPAPSHLSAYQMPFNAVAALAEWAGAPGVSMARTAIGESALAPGASGQDPGGTEGLGLHMITTGFNDALIAKYGGRGQMFNPVLNSQAMNEIFQSQGIGAWYSSTADSSNTHYNGPLLRQKGGIVQQFARGGVVGDLKHLLGVVRKSDKKGRASRMLKDFGKGLKDFGVEDKLVKQLADLDKEQEMYGEYADNAATLAESGIPEFQKHTEDEWAQKQLDVLFKLRNRLIRVQKIIKKRRKELAEALEFAKAQQKSIKKAINAADKEKGAIQDQLDKEKKEKKPNKELVASLEDKLASIGERQKVRADAMTALTQNIQPAIRERDTTLAAFGREKLDRLNQVQGTGMPMNRLRTATYGMLGGEILGVQQRLRDLGEAGTTTDALDVAGLRSVIEAARFGVFDNLPRFHTGGIVPGATTTEVPIMARGGEVVTDPRSETFVGYADIDLGEGITQRVRLEFNKRDRAGHTNARQYQR